MTVLCDKGPPVEDQAARRGTSQAGVPDGGKADARPRGGPGSRLPSPQKEVPSAAGSSAQRWGRRRGGSLPSLWGPPSWGILAWVHQCLICMAIHPLPSFPATPEWGLVPLPVPPPSDCPSPEGRTMVVGRRWWRGLAGLARLAGTIVCEALNVCTASALAAEWGTSIPRMLPEPAEGHALEHLASPAGPCQASESSCHSHLLGLKVERDEMSQVWAPDGSDQGLPSTEV